MVWCVCAQRWRCRCWSRVVSLLFPTVHTEQSLRGPTRTPSDLKMTHFTQLWQSLISCTLKPATANKLVCYLTKWSQYRTGAGRYLPRDVDPWLCTHLVYAFAVVNYANEIAEHKWNEHTLYRQVNELKHRSARWTKPTYFIKYEYMFY